MPQYTVNSNSIINTEQPAFTNGPNFNIISEDSTNTEQPVFSNGPNITITYNRGTGPTGNTGLQGIPGDATHTGATGNTGSTGCTGPSYWKLDTSGNLLYSPTTSITGIYINKPQSAHNTNTILDISGNVNINSNLIVNNISFLSNITEKISNANINSDNSCSLDYTKGSVFYLGQSPSLSNIRFNITNLPSITDSSKSYVITTIYKGSLNHTYGNVISVSPVGSSTSAVFTPNFASIPVITNGKLVTQTFGYLYFASDSSYVVSNVTCYQY